MSKWLETPEFKVGLLVVIVSALIGVMSVKASEKSGFMGGKNYWFYLENAAGLIENGSVHVAGIKVGVIDNIELDESGMAKITVLIDSKVRVTDSSRIQIRANGILGDKQVEIIPGLATDQLIGPGGKIEGLVASASLDSLITEVGKITDSLGVVAKNLKDATEGDDSKPLGKIVKNIEKLTADLSDVVGERKSEIDDLIVNVHEITETLNSLINDESETGFKQTWPRVVARLDSTMRNIDEITGKVNSGEGTIGRLINDEETVDELNTAISSVNNLLAGANKMQTSIDYHGYQLSKIGEVRSYFGIKVQPGADRFYEIGMVNDPEGVRETRTITTAPGSTIEETVVFDYKVKFTALFGKYFYNFAVKAGVIQNTGGVGLEYYAFNNRLKIGVEAYDFENFNVRPYVKLDVYRGLYLMAGGEHRFGTGDHEFRNWFVGGGLLLNNDDLKFILSRIQF